MQVWYTSHFGKVTVFTFTIISQSINFWCMNWNVHFYKTVSQETVHWNRLLSTYCCSLLILYWWCDILNPSLDNNSTHFQALFGINDFKYYCICKHTKFNITVDHSTHKSRVDSLTIPFTFYKLQNCICHLQHGNHQVHTCARSNETQTPPWQYHKNENCKRTTKTKSCLSQVPTEVNMSAHMHTHARAYTCIIMNRTVHLYESWAGLPTITISVFLNFAYHLVFGTEHNIWKLDYFFSSKTCGAPIQLDPSERANLNHPVIQWLMLAYYNEPNWVRTYYLGTETDTVPETLCSAHNILDDEQIHQSNNTNCNEL